MNIAGVPQLMPHDAAQRIEDGALLVDVREQDEWEAGRVPGAVHVPLSGLDKRIGELPRDRPLVLMCHTGVRSHSAASFLQERGFDDVANLVGGIAAWATLRLPVESGPSK